MALPLGSQEVDQEHVAGYRRQLPLPGAQEVKGMYYPGADLLYISSDEFDAEAATYPSPVTYDRESICRRLDIDIEEFPENGLDLSTLIEFFGTDDQVTFHHEFGHAFLTKASISQNISLVENVVGIQGLIGMINAVSLDGDSKDVEIWNQDPPNSLREEFVDADFRTDLTWGEGMAAHMIRHDLNQKLEQNLATPVQEAFAWIAQAYYVERPTTEALINRLTKIDEGLDKLGGWSLEHPGYDPLKHDSKAAERQWDQYIWSFKKSILSGAVALFQTLEDKWAFRLISRSAKGSLSLYFAGKSIPDRMVSLPTVTFTNAIFGLYNRRHDLAKLQRSGTSLDIIVRVFDEWVGYGTPGLDSVEERVLEIILDIDTKYMDLRSWVQGLQNQFTADIPSFVMLEDARTNQLRTFISPAGPSERFLLLSLLRWQLVHSLWSGSQQFLNKQYTPLLRDLSRTVELDTAFGGVGILSRCEHVFNQISLEVGCQTAINLGIKQYRVEHAGGLVEFKSEFTSGEFDEKDHQFVNFFTGQYEQNAGTTLGGILYQLSQYPTGDPNEGSTDSAYFELLTQMLQTHFSKSPDPSLETYIAETTVSIAQFEGLHPNVDRLDRIRNSVQDATSKRDDSQFPARVYGNATVDVFIEDGCDSPDQWARRFLRDLVVCRHLSDDDAQYLSTFVQTAIHRLHERQMARHQSGNGGPSTLSLERSQGIVRFVCQHALKTGRSWGVNPDWFSTALQQSVSFTLDSLADLDGDYSDHRQQFLAIIFGAGLEASKENDATLLAVNEAVWATVAKSLKQYAPEDIKEELRVLGRVQVKAIQRSDDLDLYRFLYRGLPPLLFDEVDIERLPSSVNAVSDCFLEEVIEKTESSEDSKHQQRELFYQHLLRVTIEKGDPATAAPVARTVHTITEETLDHRSVAVLDQMALGLLSQQCQPTSQQAAWCKVLRESVSETITNELSKDERFDFLVTLYGNALADIISEKYGETVGPINEWPQRVTEMLRVVSKDALSTRAETVGSRVSVLGFAAARLTKYGDLESEPVETGCWQVVQLARELAHKGSVPDFIVRFVGEWIGYLTLFDESAEGSAWIPTVLENSPFGEFELPRVDYFTAEAMGRGLRLMGLRVDPSTAGYWYFDTIKKARTYARRVPDREAFLAAFFAAALSAHAEYHRPRKVSGSLRNILLAADDISNELPDTTTLLPTLFVDLVSRLGPTSLSGSLLEESRRQHWFRWTIIQAANLIKPHHWEEFTEGVQKPSGQMNADRRAAIAILDSVLA